MDRDTDILLEFCRKSSDEVKHIENQRAAIANIVILVSSAIVGLFVTQEKAGDLFPLSLIILLVGAYGLAATAKLYERYLFELSRFSLLVEKLDELHPNVRLSELREAADRGHRARHSLVSRVSISKIWLSLHWVIIAVGIGLTIANWP
jgi:hypothetical protein